MENRTNWPNIHVIGTPKGEERQRMASDTVKAIFYFLLRMKVKTGCILKKKAMPIYAKSYWRKKTDFLWRWDNSTGNGIPSSSKVLRGACQCQSLPGGKSEPVSPRLRAEANPRQRPEKNCWSVKNRPTWGPRWNLSKSGIPGLGCHLPFIWKYF